MENEKMEEHHAHEHHTEHHPEHHLAPEPNKARKWNSWQIATVVLVVLLGISVFTNGFHFGSGTVLSKEDAAKKTLDYINTNLLQGQAVASLQSAEEKGDLYNLKINVRGQQIDTYVTKDGKTFFPQALELEASPLNSGGEQQPEAPVNVPKSDKPKVELFVMSHCPYGTQAEKGIIPVVEKLGDKIDFSVKFVYYAMHGQKELDEEKNQVCIEKEQKSKFLPYLKCFLEKGDGTACLTTANVDKTKLKTCVEKLDKDYKITEKFNDQTTWLSGQFPLFDVYKAENEQYDIAGSPALVINGEQVNTGRAPSAYFGAICNAFNTKPVVCSETMSSTQYSAGFGYETAATGAATANAPGCATN